jgi:hypothetical protein
MSAHFLVDPSGARTTASGGDFERLQNFQAMVMGSEMAVRTALHHGIDGHTSAPLRARVDAADPARPKWSSLDTGDLDRGAYWAAVQDNLIQTAIGRKVRGRADAASMGAGSSGPAGNLTAFLWRVIPEVRPPLNGNQIGVTTSSLAPGIEYYQLAFSAGSGEAKVWAGGSGGDYAVSHGWSMLTRPQYHLLASGQIAMIPEAHYSVMGANLRAIISDQLRYAPELTCNQLTFQGGGTDLDIWGLVNYPTLAIDYSGLRRINMTGDQLTYFLADMIDGPTIDSNQAFTPNVLAVAMRIAADMRVLRVGDNGMTVWEWFAKNFPGVRVAVMNELDSCFGTDLYAAFAYPDSGPGAPTIEQSPTIFLPEVQEGVGVRLFSYKRYAGMVIGGTIGARVGIIEA